MIRRPLHVFVEEPSQAIGQVVDRDLAARVDPVVQRVTVVDQDLGNLDVETVATDGSCWRTSFPTARRGR